MTNFKKQFPTPIFLLFAIISFSICATSNIAAQNDLEYNFLKIKRQTIEREGTQNYMTFHDHNAPNLPYHDHYYRDPLTSNVETYTVTSLEAQWYLNSRTLSYLYLPYIANRRNLNTPLNEVMKKNGLGDILVGGKYYLYNSALYRTRPNFKQYLLFGVGMKFPTGSYNDFDSKTNEIEPTLQPGSGTTDFLLSADYQLQFKHFILQAAATYRINQENRYTYRYGNRLNIGVEALYEWSVDSNLEIVPNVSLQLTDAKSNELNGKLINGFPAGSDRFGTGGKVMWGGIGMAFKAKNTQVQFDYYLPLSEELIGGQLSYNQQLEVALRWDFGKGNQLVLKGER